MWNSRRAEQFQRIAAAEEAQKAEEVRREKSMAERDQKFTQHREKLQGELKRGRGGGIIGNLCNLLRSLLCDCCFVIWCFRSIAVECDTGHGGSENWTLLIKFTK